MYAVEFQTSIKNGIVRIPKDYQNLYNVQDAQIFVISIEKQKKQVFDPKIFFNVANVNKADIDKYLSTRYNDWNDYLSEK